MVVNLYSPILFSHDAGWPNRRAGFQDPERQKQPPARAQVGVAKACPDTRIVVAHMGGHHVLDLMMLAKRIPNMYFDTSYTLLYYRGSAVIQNIVYAMRSMRFERIFYGSDYPDRSIKDTVDGSYNLLKEYGLSEDEITKILYTNAKEFLDWMNI